ncbi:hypothetical protein PybrP1_012004 [[Pythium] brassicae (nom. inval.)]|nr:hypothetical protein PybrP1_012004 [[Pythium] brassicae (nom. inval.)]
MADGVSVRHLGIQISSAPRTKHVWEEVIRSAQIRMLLGTAKTADEVQRAELAKAIIIPKLAYVARHTPIDAQAYIQRAGSVAQRALDRGSAELRKRSFTKRGEAELEGIAAILRAMGASLLRGTWDRGWWLRGYIRRGRREEMPAVVDAKGRATRGGDACVVDRRAGQTSGRQRVQIRSLDRGRSGVDIAGAMRLAFRCTAGDFPLPPRVAEPFLRLCDAVVANFSVILGRRPDGDLSS